LIYEPLTLNHQWVSSAAQTQNYRTTKQPSGIL